MSSSEYEGESALCVKWIVLKFVQEDNYIFC